MQILDSKLLMVAANFGIKPRFGAVGPHGSIAVLDLWMEGRRDKPQACGSVDR